MALLALQFVEGHSGRPSCEGPEDADLGSLPPGSATLSGEASEWLHPGHCPPRAKRVSAVHDLTYPGPFELHSASERRPDISSGMSAQFPGPSDCFVAAKCIFEMWAGSPKTPGCEQVDGAGG